MQWTPPGWTRARKIDTDERTEFMKAGKCFTCKKQGHLRCDCPQRPPPCTWTNARASTSKIEEVNSDNKEPAKVRSRKKKHSTSKIIGILREAEDNAKDMIIQEFFYEGGFLRCSNPMAWDRATGCKSVYITRYHSMRVPISFSTLHAMPTNPF